MPAPHTRLFWGFNPAVSGSALKDMRAAIRDLDLLFPWLVYLLFA